MKHHFEYNYRPYVTIDLDTIDPNNEFPEWKYEKKYKSPVKDKNVANQFQWQIKEKGKRGARLSPGGRKATKEKKMSTTSRLLNFCGHFSRAQLQFQFMRKLNGYLKQKLTRKLRPWKHRLTIQKLKI